MTPTEANRQASATHPILNATHPEASPYAQSCFAQSA